MNNSLSQFHLLKQKIASKFRQKYPQSKQAIEDWKGQDIVNFQEELWQNVKGSISEKWFYTHIKNKQNEKLPRIDVLNLLSQYAGFKDWQDFQNEHPIKQTFGINSKKLSWKKWTWATAGILVLMLVIIWAGKSPKQKYEFCFVDADTKQSIKKQIIEVFILNEKESPIVQKTNKNGCFELKTKESKIRFVVKCAYYKSDTIIRNLNPNRSQETIALKTDDYALMIHLFSNAKIEDWKKRRNQLSEMISDDARIFQIDEQNRGMEMYNKTEFINKMTMPLKSLKNIEIIETIYRKNQIYRMRFIQKK